jgi:hypothetical protein
MHQFIIIIGERRFRDDSDRIVTIKRPEVFEEYETHKSKKQMCHISFSNYLIIIHIGSVDISNNRRDYLTSYHDVISTESWEMRFLGFILGIAFSFYKIFSDEGGTRSTGSLDSLAFLFLSIVRVLSTKNNTVRRIHPCRYITVALKTMNTLR